MINPFEAYINSLTYCIVWRDLQGRVPPLFYRDIKTNEIVVFHDEAEAFLIMIRIRCMMFKRNLESMHALRIEVYPPEGDDSD